MNTWKGGAGEGDTRLFTVECASHVLVAWCGTASKLNVLSDVSFGPKRCPAELGGMGNENHSVLYTCRMPRTFTRLAVYLLRDITHYRHANDNDTVTQIPLEVDLDSEFDEKLGWSGHKLGFDWLATSAIGLLPRTFGGNTGADRGITQERDPYWHHGKTAEQSIMQSGERNTLWVGGETMSHTKKVERNRKFLALQDMLPVVLRLTQAEESGKNALLRFAAVTEEDVELPL